jgi:hypothetical protein
METEPEPLFGPGGTDDEEGEESDDGKVVRPREPKASGSRGKSQSRGSRVKGKGKGKGKDKEVNEEMDVDMEDEMEEEPERNIKCTNCIQRGERCTPGTGRSCRTCQIRKVRCKNPGPTARLLPKPSALPPKPITKKRSRSATRDGEISEGSQARTASSVSGAGSVKRLKMPVVLLPKPSWALAPGK